VWRWVTEDARKDCSEENCDDRATENAEVRQREHDGETRRKWNTDSRQKYGPKGNPNDTPEPRPAAITRIVPLPFCGREFVIAHTTETDHLEVIQMRVRRTCPDV
jgi:hypothetical protein